MSLPSIKAVAKALGITDISLATPDQHRTILVEAMRIDLKPALDYLHQKAHEAKKNLDGRADWIEDPNSPLGKMLIRIHAGDALRQLASETFCHGLKLHFFNCCKGIVGNAPANLILTQIQCQDGTIATPDC